MSKAIQLHNEEENIYPNPHFPVGSIYLSVVNTNPSTWFGGTWEQIAKGRTLVGVDTSDTDFNEVQKTGGSKYLQKHNHKIGSGDGIDGEIFGYAPETNPTGGAGHYYVKYAGVADTPARKINVKNTGSGNSENLQPYFTCYIWCRTA